MKDFFSRLHASHEKLKNYVHTAWKVPLPKWGQNLMGFIYFTIPVIGGYNVMMWAISKSHDSIGERGEKLKIKEVQGIGDVIVKENGEVVRLGKGHFGGGVKLAVSSQEEQERNKLLLAKVLQRQERILRKRENISLETKESKEQS